MAYEVLKDKKKRDIYGEFLRVFGEFFAYSGFKINLENQGSTDRVAEAVDHLVINSILLILIHMRFSICFLVAMILDLEEMILDQAPDSVQIFQVQVQMVSTDFLAQVLVLVGQGSARHPVLARHEIKMGKLGF